MQPLIPLIPPPPPPNMGHQVAAPPPPPQSTNSPIPHVHTNDFLPRPVGDETRDAREKFNPYKLTMFERCYLGLIVVGALIWLLRLSSEGPSMMAFVLVIIIYLSLVLWGAFVGRFSWSLMAKWSVKGWLLNVWKSSLFPIFNTGACMIRIDSFVIENKPSGLWNNIVFSIKQSRTSSLFLFSLLFLLMPDDLTNPSTYYGFAILLLIFSPILSAVLVPLYIFSDSSVVEVIPGQRDFAPVGMSVRFALSRLIGWGSLIIVLTKLWRLTTSSGFIDAIIFLSGDTLMILSVIGATVLAAALSYPNKLHLQWVEEFNKLWFEERDPDHTFHQIDENAYIVIPDHLLNETLTHLRKTKGDHFADAPAPHQNPSNHQIHGEIPLVGSPTISSLVEPPPPVIQGPLSSPTVTAGPLASPAVIAGPQSGYPNLGPPPPPNLDFPPPS